MGHTGLVEVNGFIEFRAIQQSIPEFALEKSGVHS
jgi:hypothetical protein